MDLSQALIKKKIISSKQLAELQEEGVKSARPLEEILIEKKIIPEEDLFKLKSEVLDIPLKDQIAEDTPLEVLALIPKESVEFYKMVPLSVDRDKRKIEVGMVYPENAEAQEALKFLARQNKFSPSIFLISQSNFQKYLNKYLASEKEVENVLADLEGELKDEAGVGGDRQNLERLVEDAPTIKMVAVMLRQAVEGEASDIHIEPTRTNSKVRFRLDGVLYPSLVLPLKIHPAIVARVKILSGLKIDETRFPQDGRFSAQFGDKRIDFRVSTFPTTLGEKVVVRILDPLQGLKTLEDLGLGGRDEKELQESIQSTFGMIIVSGPTGSGKTTTLYSIMKLLNNDGVNIVTLEDPVEYFMEGVNQSQVKPEINYTFGRGLRQILRQDPDIIMVGEIRDEETAGLAVQAALTGHLVLSTLHTNNAPGVIPRLVDMGVKPFLLPGALSLAIAQRLVRVLCTECKVPIRAEGQTKRYLVEKYRGLPKEVQAQLNLKEPITIYQAKGCKKCNMKGYAGRKGIFEMIKMTPDLGKIINTNPSEQAIFQEGRTQGMVTMEEEGVIKVLQGETSFEEIVGMMEEGM
ncbi:MAG: GspE/PulE family protein [Candidatus Pacebacteria bacterium]|nr:GspE/PulE family protein [Candidatus Paceibacterota bacterium]